VLTRPPPVGFDGLDGLGRTAKFCPLLTLSVVSKMMWQTEANMCIERPNPIAERYQIQKNEIEPKNIFFLFL
jgi:hypothetical protein